MADDEFRYFSGFGNEFATEAVDGALPGGRNSPQQAPLGLYAEQLSGTAFTQPRGVEPQDLGVPDPAEREAPGLPQDRQQEPKGHAVRRARAGPEPAALGPAAAAGRGPAAGLHRRPVHRRRQRRHQRPGPGWRCTCTPRTRTCATATSSTPTASCCSSPSSAPSILHTELGPLRVSPGEIAVIPRGIRFRVELPDKPRPRLPVRELRRRTSRCPSAARSAPTAWPTSGTSCTPHAAFEERDHAVQVVQKFGGNLWAADYDHSPLDVVAWHGNYAPYKYDTANVHGHRHDQLRPPRPVDLHRADQPERHRQASPTCDFVIFPPRWLVGEDTFRPPWFHRNIMSEYMGLVTGQYDAKAEGFDPGGGSLHNTFASHGPDADTYARASTAGAHAAEARRDARVHVRKPLDDPADRAGRWRPATGSAITTPSGLDCREISARLRAMAGSLCHGRIR